MRSTTIFLPPSLLLAGLALSLAQGGCGSKDAPGDTYSTPPPAHPAMKTGPSKEAPAAAGGHEHEHPPLTPAAGVPAKEGSSAGSSSPGGSLARKLATLGLSAQVPEGWVEETTERPMRLATLRLPKVAGDPEDGDLSISAVGGGMEQNLERWRGQFQEKPEPAITKKDAAGLVITQVEMAGTYSPMMAGSGPPRPGTKLLGAIVQVPGGDQLVFFKAVGPKATMDRWKPSFEEFVGSFRTAK